MRSDDDPRNEDPKAPTPIARRKKDSNARERLEASGRTTVGDDRLDRHLHV